MRRMRHRVQVIHDFESRLFAEIVDAGDVQQVIERKFVPAELCDVAEIRFADCVRYLTAKLRFVLKFSFERFAKRLDYFLPLHLVMPLYARRSSCRPHETRQAMRLPYNSNLRRMQSCQHFFEFLR